MSPGGTRLWPPLSSQTLRRQYSALRVADAVAAAGHSPTLLQRLSQIEAMIADLDRKISSVQKVKVELTAGQIREFVRKKLLDLPALLRDNVARAKRELIEHVKGIVLTPIENMTRYAISGQWEMLPADESVISMVARDGVEPPTPAFSELGFPVFPTTSTVAVGLLNTGKYGQDRWIVGDCRG